MIQKEFIDQVVEKIKSDPNVIGLAVAGSFITNEIDEYSDVDLILITRNRIAPDADKMIGYAKSIGDFLNGFTGEHVGERRVLICLYDNPLLHVDIKFLTIEEFEHRVEDPVVVFDRDGMLKKVIENTKSAWPALDYQWIEDRFWTWVHYTTSKLGRGENFEALDCLSLMRAVVIAPLFQVKNGQLPRGLRKAEFNFSQGDLDKLKGTVSDHRTEAIFESLEHTVKCYRELRDERFPASITVRSKTEIRTLQYMSEIKNKKLST